MDILEVLFKCAIVAVIGMTVMTAIYLFIKERKERKK